MGALSLSSPKQSPAFKASPRPHPDPPQCPEGQESVGEWARGQEVTPPLPGQAGEMGTGGERPQLTGGGDGGAVCGWSWNAGSARPAKGKGRSQRPLLRSTCPAWARGCRFCSSSTAHICRYTGTRSPVQPPTRTPHARCGGCAQARQARPRPGPAVLPPSASICTCTAAPGPTPRLPWAPLGWPLAAPSLHPPCPRCPLLLQHRL